MNRPITFLFLTNILVACSTPQHMRVYDGVSPKNADKEVVFRTTYYFRVFDHCSDSPETAKVPLNEALYRYRMTGKANPLANHIRFESGTLKAHQIDPFGASVQFNEETGTTWISSTQSKLENNSETLAQLFTDLKDEKDELKSLGEGEAPADLINAIDAQLVELTNKRISYVIQSLGIEDSATNIGIEPRTNAERNSLFRRVGELNAVKDKFSGDSDELERAHQAYNTAADEYDSAFKALKNAKALRRLKLEVDHLQNIKDKEANALADYKAELPENWTHNEVFVSELSRRRDILERAEVSLNMQTLEYETSKKNAGEQDVGNDEFAELTRTLTTAQSNKSEAFTAYQKKRNELATLLKDVTSVASTESIECKSNAIRRGFQILGPEGWRTFDQDERLIMAMHSEASPLISTMKELSGRVLNAQGETRDLLPLVSEQLKASGALAMIGPLEVDARNLDNSLDKVIKQLEQSD